MREEAAKIINDFLMDPTANVLRAVNNFILYLAKKSPGDFFAVKEEWERRFRDAAPRWPGEADARKYLINIFEQIQENERLCHMCHLSHFAFLHETCAERMVKRFYRCQNPACGAIDVEPH